MKADRLRLVRFNEIDDDGVLVSPLAAVGGQDLDAVEVVGLKGVLEELDLLAIERDHADLARLDACPQESARDLGQGKRSVMLSLQDDDDGRLTC